MPESAVTVIVGACVVGAIVLALVVAWRALRSVSRATGSIKGAVAGTALVQSIAESGATITSPSVGPDAPVYAIELAVTPPAGVAYTATTTQAVPRIQVPFLRPGVGVPVDIDPRDPSRVKVSWDALPA